MPSTENRTWSRLSPADKEVEFKTSDGNSLVEVADVSFGGVALKLDRVGNLQENDPVDICWRGTWMRGVVKHIAEADGYVRVGIEWAKSKVGNR